MYKTFRGIIHVCQAILETGSGRQLSHNGWRKCKKMEP